MNSHEFFKRRMALGGNTTVERVVNQSQRVAENKFKTSPSYYIIDVDGKQVESIVNRTNDYNIKLVHFKHDYDVRIGSIVTFDGKKRIFDEEPIVGKKYLIMEKDRDVMYSFAKMEMCNSTLKIQVGEEERRKIGYDDRGRPVYDDVVNYKDEPCIIRDRYYSSNDNAQLPLPEGKLDIFLKYQDAPNIAVNQEFKSQGKTYKIADVSYIDVINGVGLMRVHAERREGNE